MGEEVNHITISWQMISNLSGFDLVGDTILHPASASRSSILQIIWEVGIILVNHGEEMKERLMEEFRVKYVIANLGDGLYKSVLGVCS